MLETILISTILLFTTVGVVNEVIRLRINLRRSRELTKTLGVLAEELILLTETRELFQKNTKIINEKMENDANEIRIEAADIKKFIEKEYKNFLSFVRETKELMNGTIKGKEQYTPIEELNMYPRTTEALIRNGIGSVEKLCTYNEKQLLEMRSIGKVVLQDIIQSLELQGLCLQEITPVKYE